MDDQLRLHDPVARRNLRRRAGRALGRRGRSCLQRHGQEVRAGQQVLTAGLEPLGPAELGEHHVGQAVGAARSGGSGGPGRSRRPRGTGRAGQVGRVLAVDLVGVQPGRDAGRVGHERLAGARHCRIAERDRASQRALGGETRRRCRRRGCPCAGTAPSRARSRLSGRCSSSTTRRRRRGRSPRSPRAGRSRPCRSAWRRRRRRSASPRRRCRCVRPRAARRPSRRPRAAHRRARRRPRCRCRTGAGRDRRGERVVCGACCLPSWGVVWSLAVTLRTAGRLGGCLRTGRAPSEGASQIRGEMSSMTSSVNASPAHSGSRKQKSRSTV